MQYQLLHHNSHMLRSQEVIKCNAFYLVIKVVFQHQSLFNQQPLWYKLPDLENSLLWLNAHTVNNRLGYQFMKLYIYELFKGMTRCEHESGLATWLVCGGCCLFGLWLGCCLIPFCLNDMKDTRHICTNCKKTIRVHKILS